MFQQFGATRTPFPDGAIEQTASAVAGIDLSWFFQKYVRGLETLPIDSCLKKAGLSAVSEGFGGEVYVFMDSSAVGLPKIIRDYIVGDR